MFNVIEKEMKWRKDQGLPEAFEAIKRCKPVVSVGAEGPLGGQPLMADYYRASIYLSKRGTALLIAWRWYRWPRQYSSYRKY